MIFPISHEKTTVRSFPWATCLLLLALVGTFLATPRGPETQEPAERLQEVLSYAAKHPHLDIDPRVSAATGFAGSSFRAPEHSIESLLQEELDRRTEAWLSALEQHPHYRWGLIPAAPRLLSFASYLFLHATWLHLILNLLWLYLCAPFVEDQWGHGGLLAFFVAVGALAGGVFLLRDPGAFIPLIGASGAIAGILGAFLVLHGRTKMDFVFWLPVLGGTFSAPAWLMIPIFFGFDVWAALTQETVRGGGTAYWAHIGGFLSGLVITLSIQGIRLSAPSKTPATDPRDVYAEALRLHREGDSEAAMRILVPAVRQNPMDEITRDTLWNLARQLNRQHQAVPAILSGVRQALREGKPADALNRWHRVLEALPDLPVDPALAVDLAATARRLERPSEAAELLQSALSHWRKDVPFPVVERAHHLAGTLGSPLRKAFLSLALEHPAADPRRRTELLTEASGEER